MNGQNVQSSISEDTVAQFERDGAVLLRGLFDPEWIDLVGRGITRNLKNPGTFFKDSTAPGSTGRYLSEFWAWFHIPEIREYALNSPAGAIASRLLRCDEVVFLEDNWFLKEAGAAGRTPWHQDQPYYHLVGPMMSVWMPLDPVTKDNGIEFVRGSHRWGKLFIPSNFRTGAPTQDPTGTSYELIPDIEADRKAYEILSWVMEPGDCVAFYGTTIHGAPGNPSVATTIRRMSTRWVDKSTRYHRRDIEYSDLIGKDRLSENQPVHECAELFPTLSYR